MIFRYLDPWDFKVSRRISRVCRASFRVYGACRVYRVCTVWSKSRIECRILAFEGLGFRVQVSRLRVKNKAWRYTMCGQVFTQRTFLCQGM